MCSTSVVISFFPYASPGSWSVNDAEVRITKNVEGAERRDVSEEVNVDASSCTLLPCFVYCGRLLANKGSCQRFQLACGAFLHAVFGFAEAGTSRKKDDTLEAASRYGYDMPVSSPCLRALL